MSWAQLQLPPIPRVGGVGLIGLKNGLLQMVARAAPGAGTRRVRMHRWHEIKTEAGVSIAYDALIETSKPHLVTIGDDAVTGIRATILAHFRALRGVTMAPEASVGQAQSSCPE